MDIINKKNKSVKSINEDSIVSLDVRQTSSIIHNNDLYHLVNSYELYEYEVRHNKKYRFILTINPFCTNVLFNPLTEVLCDNGGVLTRIVDSDDNFTLKTKKKDLIRGLTTLDRSYVIRNTEYSKPEIGFEYQYGLDILNNHLLRNKTFKTICDYKTNTRESDTFNTLNELNRHESGDLVKINVRVNKDKFETNVSQHLYNKEEVLSFNDSIVTNIKESNGWYYFNNKTNIDVKNRSKTDKMSINRLSNKNLNERFLDFYPDRSLFSFNPKFNKRKHRFEHNWHIILTYLYDKKYDHDLVSYNGVNSLKLMTSSILENKGIGKSLMFRSFIKHNLKPNESFKLYIVSNNEIKLLGNTFIVKSITNKTKYNSDYYFEVGNYEPFIDVLLQGGYLTQTDVYDNDGNLNDDINEKISKLNFRFSKCNGSSCYEYYIRVLRKVPNFSYKKEILTHDIAKDKVKFSEYIKENTINDGIKVDFRKETYPLGFSNTVFNDLSTQVTYLDDIDVNGLYDHLNRPISEFYVTLVKTNNGHDIFYKKEVVDEDKVEASHCFGYITSGFLLSSDKSDNNNPLILEKKANLSDIKLINNVKKNANDFLFNAKTLEYNITDLGSDTYDNDDTFLCDIVEYDKFKDKEVVLTEVYHRFNTKQRELQGVDRRNSKLTKYTYDEIKRDDLDGKLNQSDTMAFEVETYDLSNETTNYRTEDGVNILIHPEGYYYKPHYKISIAKLSELKQDSNKDINILNSSVIVVDGIRYIAITTRFSHNLRLGDRAILSSDKDNVDCTIFSLDSKTKFLLNVLDDNIDIIELSEKLKNGEYILCVKNNNIPSYANKIDKNTYLWRDSILDTDKFPFSNGALYINKEINFFLKRQGGLLTNNYKLCSDIKPFYYNYEMVNYLYVEESEYTC